ncbi:hypothetical protein FVA81_16315 [Rhizobium sp. WL3]|uniref:hypothetical protein n=1 Tax=Rhizobium sp. WL3 TaxID=2603277 RepID=UPI0011C20BBF|nr:hypothetical protein [Rhizobium sp. WL3]QEE46078.1 hypothetical protein FVA81_16315 [Rhizobium sp. WL3]
MRQIEVSVDVFAAIWAARNDGENSEDEVLRRLLDLPTKVPTPPQISLQAEDGFKDARFRVELPEGFEIYRVYKGQEIRARATKGKLQLVGSDHFFLSFNQLSRAATGNIENAWKNWYFTGRDGKRHSIEGLRSDSKRSVRHLI